MGNDKNSRLIRMKSGWVFCVILLLAMLAIVRVAQAVEVGDKAPDFTLPSTKGDPLTLSQFLGKRNVVLEFYVLDFTPT